VSAVSKHDMWSYYCWICRTLSSISKHNMWSLYGWVCRCCRQLVNTICVVLWLCLLLFSPVCKHNMSSYYSWVFRCFPQSVNTIYGRIMAGFVLVLVIEYVVLLWFYLSLLPSVSKHNMWS